MYKIMWQLPVPSTQFVENPVFQSVGGRTCKLLLLYENDVGVVTHTVTFEGVEAYKCTYLTSCTKDMIQTAYDKLVDCGKSPWLKEAQEVSDRVGLTPKSLKHLMIFFDDGPCYEILCEKVSV
jgi:hypothetical protein